MAVLIMDSDEPSEYYACSCGLKFNRVEGATLHLENTTQHSIHKVVTEKIKEAGKMRFSEAA